MLAVIWDLISVQMIASLGGDVIIIIIVSSILLSLVKIEGEVKEPTLLFDESRGTFLGGVVYLSSITHLFKIS